MAKLLAFNVWVWEDSMANRWGGAASTAAAALLALTCTALQAAPIVQGQVFDLTASNSNVLNSCGFQGAGGNNCVNFNFLSGSVQFNPFDTSLGTLLSAILVVDVDGTASSRSAFSGSTFSLSYGSLSATDTFGTTGGGVVDPGAVDLTGQIDLLALMPASVLGASPFSPYTLAGRFNYSGLFPGDVTLTAKGNLTLTYTFRPKDDEQQVPEPGSLLLAMLGLGALGSIMGRRRAAVPGRA